MNTEDNQICFHKYQGTALFCMSENNAIKYIEDQCPSIYVLFKCGSCGVPWKHHEESCFYHDQKNRFDDLRMVASKISYFESIFNRARNSGWQEESVPQAYYGGEYRPSYHQDCLTIRFPIKNSFPLDKYICKFDERVE